jgi:hypothetical protein
MRAPDSTGRPSPPRQLVRISEQRGRGGCLAAMVCFLSPAARYPGVQARIIREQDSRILWE